MLTSTIKWYHRSECLPPKNCAILLHDKHSCFSGSFIRKDEDWSFRNEDGTRNKEVEWWAYYPHQFDIET